MNSFYWFCALSGSGMFLIQFALNFIGLGDSEEHHDICDAGRFKWLSRQALTGFLMMFGWSAITCQEEFHLPGAFTIAIALVSGMITIFATAFIFQMAKKLQSSGTLFTIDKTIGQEAIVYQRIPQNGIGVISVCIDEFVREVDACSLNHQEVASFSRVKILGKIDDKTVIIKKI